MLSAVSPAPPSTSSPPCSISCFVCQLYQNSKNRHCQLWHCALAFFGKFREFDLMEHRNRYINARLHAKQWQTEAASTHLTWSDSLILCLVFSFSPSPCLGYVGCETLECISAFSQIHFHVVRRWFIRLDFNMNHLQWVSPPLFWFITHLNAKKQRGGILNIYY